MNERQKTAAGEDDRVSLQKIYALLCGLKTSVDRLALQVKLLRGDREGNADE